MTDNTNQPADTQIIGLHKGLSDPATGAPIEFWAIGQYTVRFNGGSQVVLNGWVSKAMRDQGKSPLATSAVELPPAPESVSMQWFYEQVPLVDGSMKDAVAILEVVAEAAVVPEAGAVPAA